MVNKDRCPIWDFSCEECITHPCEEDSMGEPRFFEFMNTPAIWVGICWQSYSYGFEINILIPFCTFSFFFKKKER